jgi:zinc transport system permease protein
VSALAGAIGALPLPWPFDREYMQLALVAGLVIGVCAPLIGVFLVQQRLSLMGDGIGHLAFAGVAAGLLLEVWPLWTALIVAVVGALAIEWLRSRGRTTSDLALALWFYGGIAAGIVLASRAGNGGLAIVPYLFGSILTIDHGDVRVIVLLGLGILATLAIFGRALFAIVVDEESARVNGIPVGVGNAVLAVLTAVTVVAAMRVVGVLLVAALMVLPVASGRILARSFRGTLTISSAIGAVSVVLGLAAARRWALAPGGTIVLVAAGLFAVTNVAGRPARAATPAHRHDHLAHHDHEH